MSTARTPRQPRASELLPELERRFVLESFPVTAFGRELELISPRNAEELLSEEDFERDERLPYWADLWPSSYALADRVASDDSAEGGERTRLLELGCGLGLVTIAALSAGFDVLATDYYSDALLFTRANAWRVLGSEPATRLVDWRELPADLGSFGRVVAADVLYEPRYAAIVADVLARTLAPAGEALIADPGRTALPAFLRECEARGLVVASVERWRYAEAAARQTIVVHQIIRREDSREGPRKRSGARLA